jgi:hypothetical protein
MERFVYNEYLIHLRKQLARTTDEAKLRQTSTLLSATTTTIGLEQPEEEILTYEVSDEALETAAGSGSKQAGNYTLFYCTYLHICPI